MAEKRELENLSRAAMWNGERARARQARAALEIALELAKRNCKPVEYDEQIVADVDGSYIHSETCAVMDGGNEKDRKRKKTIQWGFVGV